MPIDTFLSELLQLVLVLDIGAFVIYIVLTSLVGSPDKPEQASPPSYLSGSPNGPTYAAAISRSRPSGLSGILANRGCPARQGSRPLREVLSDFGEEI